MSGMSTPLNTPFNPILVFVAVRGIHVRAEFAPLLLPSIFLLF